MHPNIQRMRESHFSWAGIHRGSTLCKALASHWDYLAVRFKRLLLGAHSLAREIKDKQIFSIKCETCNNRSMYQVFSRMEMEDQIKHLKNKEGLTES